MSTRPVIFVSAVSRELQSARQLLVKTLKFLDFDVEYQDVFGMEQGDIRSMLRNRIDACAGVIQIVGHCYGFEPPAPDPAFGRVSYTQYEVLYAKKKGKKVWLLFLDRRYPTDSHDAESPEKAALQRAYTEKMSAAGHPFLPLDCPDQLQMRVHSFNKELSQLRRKAGRLSRLVVALLLIIAGATVWLLMGQRTQTQTRSAQAIKIEGVLDLQGKMEQALSRLAEAESRARAAGATENPEQLRARAYALVESELRLPTGTLAARLPAFASDLLKRDGTAPLLRAQAAYALNKFAEAEKFFLESASQAQAALAINDPQSTVATPEAEKRRKNAVQSLVGAAQSALGRIDLPKALEHYQAAAALTRKDIDPIGWSGVHLEIANALLVSGRFHEAETLAREVTSILNHELGAEHQDTLRSRSCMAVALSSQGKFTEAEKEKREILGIQERVLGEAHADTLGCRNNLTADLLGQAKYAEAEQELRKVLAIQQRARTLSEFDEFMCMANLGQVLLAQSKGEEAMKFYPALMDGMERFYGKDHPELLLLMDRISASPGGAAGQVQSEQTLRDYVKLMEKMYGRDNPLIMRARNSLALHLQEHGKVAEAEHELREMLEIEMRTLGRDHPHTLTTRMNLGGTLASQGRLDEAAVEFREAMQTQERVLGKEHPATLSSRTGAAIVLQLQGKIAEAEHEFRSVLELQERTQGAEDPDTLLTRTSLANILLQKQDFAAAERELRTLLPVEKRVLGEWDSTTLKTWMSLGIALAGQSRYAEAEKEHVAVLKVLEKALGPEHPDTMNCKMNLGSVLYSQAKYAEAAQMYLPLQKSLQAALGAEHPQVAKLSLILAHCFAVQKDFTQASDFIRKAQPGIADLFRSDNPEAKENLELLERLKAEIRTAKEKEKESLKP